ncbi:hypothetical protein [Halorubrum vacuolatum]|uniref:Uncharacterized protein n=1 Tax=Halorubrum vacuolatum TaxID=63740 RepID=A0A238XT97_HALVU|nr:hypothetical protein [Halorubrum vacuolatum]SNR61229.1 hypothetical protein SAMN06264855_12144 [Halorubrum vacuolatum]
MAVVVTLECTEPECPTQTRTIEIPESDLKDALKSELNGADEVAKFLGLTELFDIGQADPETLWWLIRQLYIYYNMKQDIDNIIGGDSTKEPSPEDKLLCNSCGEPMTAGDIRIE